MSFPLAFTRRSIVLKSWKPQSIYILRRLSREVVEIYIDSFMIVMVTSTTLIYISSFSSISSPFLVFNFSQSIFFFFPIFIFFIFFTFFFLLFITIIFFMWVLTAMVHTNQQPFLIILFYLIIFSTCICPFACEWGRVRVFVCVCVSEAGQGRCRRRRMYHGLPTLLYASADFVLTISGVYILSPTVIIVGLVCRRVTFMQFSFGFVSTLPGYLYAF